MPDALGWENHPSRRSSTRPTHAYYGLGGKTGVMALVFDTLEKIFGRIGMTINTSADERAFALEHLLLPARKLILINNGVDAERFHPPTARSGGVTAPNSAFRTARSFW